MTGIKEVHHRVSDWNSMYDEYTVYYKSGRTKMFYDFALPKYIRKFITDGNTEAQYVYPGGYHRYFQREVD